MTKAAELAKMGEVLTNSQIGGRRNIVINGAMQVAQRGTSSSGLGASGGYFTMDRMLLDFSGTAGRLTMSQSTDAPNGFANSLKLDCTTADTSIAAAETGFIQYRIEGQDLQQFKKGTSDAEKMTVSFYVKGNGNATYICELYDGDNARQISKTFAVTSSWNRVVLTYDGDTTGAFDDDNALSLYIIIWIHSGSNFNSGTLSTTWTAQTAANRAVGGSSFFISTDNELFITGVQMEVGSQATPFEHRSFGEELQLCKRYAYKPVAGQAYAHFGGGLAVSATLSYANIPLPVEMRINPALTTNGTFRNYAHNGGKAITTNPTVLNAGSTTMFIAQSTSSGGGMTAGDFVFLGANNDADAFLLFDAELQEITIEMNITLAKYMANENGDNCSIVAVIDGTTWSVPLVVGNRYYDAIQEWVAEGNTIEDAD